MIFKSGEGEGIWKNDKLYFSTGYLPEVASVLFCVSLNGTLPYC